jgi:hypothetical protein
MASTSVVATLADPSGVKTFWRRVSLFPWTEMQQSMADMLNTREFEIISADHKCESDFVCKVSFPNTIIGIFTHDTLCRLPLLVKALFIEFINLRCLELGADKLNISYTRAIDSLFNKGWLVERDYSYNPSVQHLAMFYAIRQPWFLCSLETTLKEELSILAVDECIAGSECAVLFCDYMEGYVPGNVMVLVLRGPDGSIRAALSFRLETWTSIQIEGLVALSPKKEWGVVILKDAMQVFAARRISIVGVRSYDNLQMRNFYESLGFQRQQSWPKIRKRKRIDILHWKICI